jgi:putative pyoverdin transport system ATP-binding/permease protein
MDVIKAILREHPEAWRRALLIAGLAGVANAAILGLINRGAAVAATDNGLIGMRLLLMFFFCMFAFYFGKRYALIQASIIVEHMVRERLVRLADAMRRSDLEIVENLGRGELYSKLAKDTSLISQSGLILVNAAQQSFVLLFSLLYIAYLSRAAFVATLFTIGVGVFVYTRHSRRLEQILARLTVKEAELIDVVGDMVDGFKEIRLSHRKNDALFGRLKDVSGATRDLKIDAQTGFCIDIMFSDLFFYSLLAIVVFMLPRLVPTYGAVVLMTTAAILFIIGPLQMVVQAAPVFERARSALFNLQELENKLEGALADRSPRTNGASAGKGKAAAPAVRTFKGFETITLDGACFTYGLGPGVAAVSGHGEGNGSGNGSGNGNGFSIGPMHLRIQRGETIFLVGGNGSGKTTALKLMTGLYQPQRGAVKVDHELIDRHNVQGYRELFSTVFTQFHLFDRLYGLEHVEDERVNQILDDLQLAGKTRFENGRFTNLELSTGQRKRLALAICLLEGKDVLVFDEWAADQDPHFRKHFYENVLRQLKAEGKTIIAATHDDRYFGVADRVIRMEYGVAVDEPRTH